MKFKYIYNGMWGVEYDPIAKTMMAGYAVDCQPHVPTFMITEIEEEDVDIAIVMCAELYSCYGVIITSFEKLIQEYLVYLG
jgi:hypothetical protein